jgi:glyoxylase-like metal-dependent hydrolase (beta-lactamase superfamily II)
LKDLRIILIAVVVIAVIAVHSLLPKIREGPSERPSTPELRLARTGCNTTILYDNYPFDPRLRTAWGFSCLVAVESSTILFDTGGNGALLMENMEALGVDAETIDIIVISHIHMDHRGGLPHFLAVNPDVEVYIPASFESNVKDNIKRRAAEVFEVVNRCRYARAWRLPASLARA